MWEEGTEGRRKEGGQLGEAGRVRGDQERKEGNKELKKHVGPGCDHSFSLMGVF